MRRTEAPVHREGPGESQVMHQGTMLALTVAEKARSDRNHDEVPSSLLSLDRDTLNKVLELSEPEIVVRLSCTCTALKEAASDRALWETFCRRRWKHLNVRAFPERPPPQKQQKQESEVLKASPGSAPEQQRQASECALPTLDTQCQGFGAESARSGDPQMDLSCRPDSKGQGEGLDDEAKAGSTPSPTSSREATKDGSAPLRLDPSVRPLHHGQGSDCCGLPDAAGKPESEREAAHIASTASQGDRGREGPAGYVKGDTAQQTPGGGDHGHADVAKGGGRPEEGVQRDEGQEIEGPQVLGTAFDGQQRHARETEGKGGEGQKKEGEEVNSLKEQGCQGQPQQGRQGQYRNEGQAVQGGEEANGQKAQQGDPLGVGKVTGVAWRKLYSHSNGWGLGFKVQEVPTFPYIPERDPLRLHKFALTTPAEAGWSLAEAGPDDEILMAAASNVEWQNFLAMYTMGGAGKGSGEDAAWGKPMRKSWIMPDSLIPGSPVVPFPSNRVAFSAGGDFPHEHLLIYRIPYEDEPPSLLGTVGSHDHRQGVMDLIYCPANQGMYSLHEHVYEPDSAICVHDLTAMRTTAVAKDSVASHEFSCICMGVEQDASGNELFAGSVHHGGCYDCNTREVPGLCFHKSPAQTAAICVFDLRASLSMVSRYSTHRLTMYPRMCSARSNYIFTSHASNPLCVWDKRHMTLPVYEEKKLVSFSPDQSRKYPLGNPARFTRTQAMYLDTDGDVLVGRADNGMFWLWDLSRTLGWTDGSGPKSWHTLAEHVKVPSTFRDQPIALGAWEKNVHVYSLMRIYGGRHSCLLGFARDLNRNVNDPGVLLSASFVPADPSD